MIAFVDVDGTLVDYGNVLPESARRAVELARAAGHRVYACTGRSKTEMEDLLARIELDGLIGANGGYVEDHGEVLFHQGIPADVERRLVDWLDERGLAYFLESNNGLFASRNFREGARGALRAYVRGKGVEDADELEADQVMTGLVFGGELYRDDVNKVSFVLRDYQDHLDSARDFPELEAKTWGGRGEEALFGDLGAKGVDKARSVELLLAHLGVPREQSVAFGDAKVDVPLFEACGASCCMGSGGEEAKAAADFVSTDVEEDGLWNGFVHFHLV
ncbi:Cof-type HAD-IIB family hydrolase [uncultured Olsenella sp.]|uniref:Cof-type HAD-IIB family hydrolase n=1 Tax=uncultured Olsenella sp. TaxID=190764 RepID=UPI0026DD899A|nr:Cof-type HAD-IIB family hydrolase [uncultured Olsenella sp.]